MAAAGVAFNGIVPELLTNNNYENWSVLVKNYLRGQGLWDVVSTSAIKSEDEEWQMKNAKALHVIQLSCGPHAFHEVKKCESAKIAWNQLSLSNSYRKSDLDIEQGMLDDGVGDEDRKKLDDIFRGNGNIKQLYEQLKSRKWADLPEGQVLQYGALLLTGCINAKIFDVALALLQRYPDLPITHKEEHFRPLYVLAQMPAVFPSGSQLNMWQMIFNKRVKDIYETKLNHYLLDKILQEMMKRMSSFNHLQLNDASAYNAILMAAKNGTIELLRSMRKVNRHLQRFIDENNRDIIIYAIRNHRLDLLDDMFELLEGKKCLHTDKFGNNMLHLAAESKPFSLHGRISCAAVQMQRELQLFKMVENMVHPNCNEAKNVQGKTPPELFSESHKELAEAGEIWARRSAASFSLVGTLIITIMFAAVFTVPGGYHQETGIPIFLNKNWLKVFIIADAISLFLSTASVLIFVGILSSRYSKTDFLAALPSKLVAGVFILFLSVVSMVVTFGAALNLMLRGERNIFIIAMVFACIPIGIFVTTQLPLFFEFFNSSVTYVRVRYIFKSIKKKIPKYFGLKCHQLKVIIHRCPGCKE